MTGTKSYRFYKKCAVTVLGLLLAVCLIAGGILLLPFSPVYAEGTVSATSIFETSGADYISGSDDSYAYIAYEVSGGGRVAFQRDMALKWYERDTDGANAYDGTAQYFSTEFSFAELNFTSFTLTMETTEMSQSKEGKAVNTIVFTPSEAGDALNVSVNGEAAGDFAYTAGDTLVVSFTDDDTFGNFDLLVENLNGGVSLSGKQFTNIGKNFADYASSSSDTPVTPLTFSAELAEDAESPLVLTILSLNGQSFELTDDGRVTDSTAPVLVVDSEIKRFVLGTQFDFEMTAIDVCDSSISSSDRTSYYYVNPVSSNISFDQNGDLQTSVTSGEGEDAETTEYYVEWESDRYFFESDFLGADGQLNDPSISIAVSLTDDSDNTGWYFVEWYGTYDAGSAGSGYGIPVVEPEADSEVRPDAGFYTVKTVEGTPDEPVADGTASTYQNAVDAAAVTEDEDGNEVSIQVGDGAYFYLPSLKAYISDTTCGYTDMEFTVYYTVNGGETQSGSGLSYDELSIELSSAGNYRFRVVPTNASGLSSYGVFETSEGSGQYKYAEITSDNVWDALNLADFTFAVTYNGPSVEASDNDDIGYVDATFTFEDFEVIALSGYQSNYTLYRIVLLDAYADEYESSDRAADVQTAYAEGRIASSREEAEANPEQYIGYTVAIAEYDDELDEDEGDNVYNWNPDSSLSFVPQEIGYYMLTTEVASYPWSNAHGTVSGQKAVYISAESDIQAGETYWLQNNILSVVFLAVGAACLIAIVVLLLIRPKKKSSAAAAVKALEKAEGAEPAQETEQSGAKSIKQKRKERRNKK